MGQSGPRSGLMALPSSDPAVKTRQRCIQRCGFAQGAAGIWIAAVQLPRAVLPGKIEVTRAQNAHILQAQIGCQLLLIGQRLGKEQSRVDKEHRCRGAGAGHHMQQDCCFRSKRRHRGDLARPGPGEGGGDDILSVHLGRGAVQSCRNSFQSVKLDGRQWLCQRLGQFLGCVRRGFRRHRRAPLWDTGPL